MELDDLDDLYKEDINDWIATKLNYLLICLIRVEFGTKVERIESRDLAANQDNVLDRVYSRLGHVTGSQTNPLFDYYHDESQRIARWLMTLKRPIDMSR